jgi:class 3 adenylate cyclase
MTLLKHILLSSMMLVACMANGQTAEEDIQARNQNNADSAIYYFKQCKLGGNLDTTLFYRGLEFLYYTNADEKTYDRFIGLSTEFSGTSNNKYYNMYLYGLFYIMAVSTHFDQTITFGHSLITQYENSKQNDERDCFLSVLAMLRQPYRVSDKLKEGFEYYTERLERYLNKKDSIAVSTCYLVLSGFYRTKGLYDLSVYHCQKSISYIPPVDADTTVSYSNLERLVNNTSVLGQLYNFVGDYRKGIYYSKQAIDLSLKHNIMTNSYGYEYKNIAYAKMMLNENDSVIQYLDLSLVGEDVDDGPHYLASSHLVRGIYYLRQNILDSAEVYLNKCQNIIEKYSLFANTISGILNPDYYLALVRMKQNRFKEAEALIIQEMPKLTNLRTELMNDHRLLIEIYLKLGDFEKSQEALAMFNKIQDELIADEKLNRTLSFDTEQKIANAESTISQLTSDKKIADISRNYLIGIAVLLLSAALVLYNRFRITRKQKKLIEHEQRRSEELLLNILPSEVAEELKEKGSADAKQFDEVTVMFTDFKGFTKISEKLTPSELVAEIDTCFKAFDHIINKHNIEKIKTIGDAYMCAGGLPVLNKTHASDVVLAALEIQQFMQQHLKARELQGKELFEIRIGIHTGPVVAGIVGVKKFAYDIWGDTVNTASRMESSGEVGKVNISGSTFDLVKDQFNCIHRGKIAAKGKGEIDMYFVESARSI